MQRVEGHPHLYRDEKSGAIVNGDSSSYTAYMQAKDKKRIERKEIDNMKQDISDIKEMLATIVSKL
tara:strand:- start:13678 stop:13875 length:198 start_codon:yes stop_codon:yes gene_type:complete